MKFEANASLNTIKGYRTAILNTLNTSREPKLDACDPLFNDLFRSFKIQRPLKQPTAPKWNLCLVFNALTLPPFEPHLERADIKYISWKTLFLILMACAKRRGHVFHLDATQISYGRNYSEVSIGVLPEFTSKRQAEANTPIYHQLTFPALTIASDKADQSLCPVRALRIYLEATKKYREGRKRLFLPLAQGKLDFRADVLTQWIRQFLIHAYKTCPTEQAILHRCLHETRSIATSWALFHNVQMTSLLRAAEWKSANVFINNYMRDMSHVQDGTSKFGPIVVAEHIV
jgi:hypothetical protein